MAVLLTFALSGILAFGQTPVESSVKYWVGSGSAKCYLVVNFCDHSGALVWGYKYDGSANKTVANMLTEIDNADSRLSIFGISNDFVTDFQFNDTEHPNWTFDTDEGSIMYSVNGSFLGGISGTNISDGDVIEFGGLSCASWGGGDTWSLPLSYVSDPNAPATPTFNVTVASSSYGRVTPAGVTSVNSGDSLVLRIAPNAGYHLGELLVGTNDVTSQVIGDSLFVLRNITADANVSVKFAVNKNNNITPADITYWVGSGSNEAIVILNTCTPDTALAWGVRFSADSILVQSLLDTIVAKDSRFSYTLAGTWLSGMSFTENGVVLDNSGDYLMFNVDELPTNFGISEMWVKSGSIAEFGGYSCAIADDYWTNVWTTEITPVTAPAVTATPIATSVSMKVYPNPAVEFVRVESERDFEGEVQIISLEGRVLRKTNFTGTTEIYVADLPAGVYSLRVVSRDGVYVYTEKMVLY